MQDKYKNLYCSKCKNHFEWIESVQYNKTIDNISFKDGSKGERLDIDGKSYLRVLCFNCGTTTDFVGR